MTEERNGGIAAAASTAETIEQWHRLIEWAGGTYPEARELSREDRRYLMQHTSWRQDPDCDALREALEDEAREWPLSLEFRADSWQLSPTSCEPDQFRILLCTGGPAVQIVGDLTVSGYPADPELQGQDWFTPWQAVDCDSDALQWFCELFVFGA